jgi:predicted helicase
LIRQGLLDWTREYLAGNKVPEWLCVCSAESTGKLERDEFVGEVYELGIPTTTDQATIQDFLKRPTKAPRVVFTTYQSAGRLAKAARATRFTFDLAILDEAHKTVGATSKAFATLLFDKNVRVKHRLFMTATERVLRGDSDDVLSMDDEEIYGQRFFLLTFKEAIRRKLISDYRILTVTVSDANTRQLVTENRLLDVGKKGISSTAAQSLAAGVALRRALKEHEVRHAI